MLGDLQKKGEMEAVSRIQKVAKRGGGVTVFSGVDG